MRKLAFCISLFVASHLFAQSAASPPANAAAGPSDVPTLHAGTQIVVVDVVVTDAYGKPVHALKPENFNVTEDKLPQKVAHFEEHSDLIPPQAGPKLPPMPAGTFTDYTPVPPNGALNVLLLDTLNTPMTDQMYVRNQLKEYVKKTHPGTRIAIFGLATHLYMLQGFTQDDSVLRDAVEHKLMPRASVLLDDPAGSGATENLSDTLSDMGVSVSANLTQFEAETTSYQTEMRIEYTIEAFTALAHYLTNFPGRKNLIWFSGSFPIDILPDADIPNGFSVEQENDEAFREMTNLLSQAQVAVYPVDARGLMTQPVFSAANSGHQYARNPRAFSKSISDFANSQGEEHMTMDQLADDTGGVAFYNNNDLAAAVSRAIELGSNYYTMEYTPVSKKWNGDYRSIKVALSPDMKNLGYKLAYRHGYYSPEPTNSKKKSNPNTPSGVTTVGAINALSSGEAYSRAVMARGAPAPEDLLFKVRVLPAAAETEDILAPENHVDPEHPIKPPFQRFAIDFATLTNAIQVKLGADGKRSGGMEFIGLLYDPDGKLLNATSATVQFDMSPETYKAFLHGVGGHLELSAPAKGDMYFRLAVHDLTSNRYGVVEVPGASVSKLPSAPPPTVLGPGGKPVSNTRPAGSTPDPHSASGTK